MVKIRLLLALSYRWEVYINLLGQIGVLFVTAFFWHAAYSKVDVAAGVNERQMITYAIMAIVMGNVFSISIEDTLRGKVRMGNIAIDYIKPINVFLMYFFEEFGGIVTALLQSALPVFVCACLFIIAPLPASAAHLGLFAVSSVLSYMIQWLLSAMFGLLYLKVIDMGPLGNVKSQIIRLLAGVVVPIWFFPQIVQDILKYLPFIYMYQFPLSIYIGRASFDEIAAGFIVQSLWLIVFFICFIIYKRRTEGNIMVQGG